MRLVLFFVLITCTAAWASVATSMKGRSAATASSSASSFVGVKKIGHHSALQMNAASIVADAPATKRGGDASVTVSTFNLAKSIIGAGVLSLPSGIALFSNDPKAVIPASLICAFMGVLSAYTFSLIGKSCEQTNANSFQDAWAKSVDPKTAWMISAGITAKCFLAALAYSIIIGDSFTALGKTFGFPAAIASRTNVILAVATFILLPLCSLKSLAALAPFSLLGLSGTLYTAIFMAIRYFDGSYAVGGRFHSAIAASLRPSHGTRFALNHLVFVLVSMLSTSYIAHFNAPKFYNELENTSLPRFNFVVNAAFLTSIVTFVFMMSIGFLTFGGNTSGFVLNNYASHDQLATFARLAVGAALLTGFPFTFTALREGILDLRGVTGDQRQKLTPRLTLGLLGLVTGMALVLKDVGFVVSVSGALFGAALMFCVPAYMNICNIRTKGTGSRFEVGVNYGIVGLGAVMGALGVAISVLKQLGKL